MSEPAGLSSIGALLLLARHRARVTWGLDFVMIEVSEPRGDMVEWRVAAREKSFVHAVMSARDVLGWKLDEGFKA